ncbi:hypothetical protein [Palleronia caenipelagi]|uniref:Uncharacterized protein n=1 Tax=Palleronia caenipelagi TaxID=2489174 RepID=A0A547Q7I1_9RHOB|nr:hypothetical protein [Palleronia caenipelagi]TRD22345.1 hypothetical protein FEV53_04605 [Palleronia caenipelagi]
MKFEQMTGAQECVTGAAEPCPANAAGSTDQSEWQAIGGIAAKLVADAARKYAERSNAER